MIHSLAGGELRGEEFNNFAKVEILEGEFKGKRLWFLSTITGLEVGDSVLVPVGNIKMGMLGKVIRIDNNVGSFACPVPLNKAKYILRKV